LPGHPNDRTSHINGRAPGRNPGTRRLARSIGSALTGGLAMVVRRHGGRLSAWSLMVGVAVVAVVLAAARIDSAPGAGIAIIAACISYLACRYDSVAVARRRELGLTTGPLRRAALFLSSASVAFAIIGLSDLAFLVGYYGYLKVADEIVITSHMSPSSTEGYMAIGAVIGVVLALCVASSLRRTVSPPEGGTTMPARGWLALWTVGLVIVLGTLLGTGLAVLIGVILSPCVAWSLRRKADSPERAKPTSARTWPALWPVGLVIVLGALLCAELARERYSFRRMMAEFHAEQEAQADSPDAAAVHAWLKRWFEYAAVRPWLPDEPTRISPGR
jgi:hypothetical protein